MRAVPTASPCEHQPIIFNDGLQSKVISCPLCSISDSTLSARTIWSLPAHTALASHSAMPQVNGERSVALIATCIPEWAGTGPAWGFSLMGHY